MNGRPLPSGRARREAGPDYGRWASTAAFLIPAFIWVEFTLVGRIFLPELILFALLPFLLAKRGRLLSAPLPRTFLILAVSWLMAQVLTDVIRESDFHDYSRGWSKIIFTMLNFCALYLLLYGSRRRLVLFALGMVAGRYLQFLLNPSAFAEIHPWKFGLGIATTLAVVLLALWRPVFRVPVLPCLPILLVGLYSMTVGSRTYAGVSILVALYVFAQQIAGRRGGSPGGIPPARSAVFLAVGVMTAALILELYEYMAVGGYLTERTRRVYEMQTTGGLFDVLLGGRAEILASLRAVMDSPIIGHGSWAKDPEYAAYLLDLRQFGYDTHHLSRLSDGDLIPTHSHLMGAWVESGIVGAVFWLWVMVLFVRVLAHQYLVRDTLGPLVAFVGFLTLWDIFFSPFGAEHRYLVSFKIVLMMYAWDALRARIYGGASGGAHPVSAYRVLRGPDGSLVSGPAPHDGRRRPAETAPHPYPPVSRRRPPG